LLVKPVLSMASALFNAKQISGRCKYSIFDSDIPQRHLRYTAPITTHFYNQLAEHKLHQTHKDTLLSRKIVCGWSSVWLIQWSGTVSSV